MIFKLKEDKGQVSIFFATTIVVIITFMAFIINIGIFVKAKINLQNATDAAAYAGASVQSRQLSNIAYMNWEMRNVFKEWMFKYYVLGSLSLEAVTGNIIDSTCPRPPSGRVSYTMACYKRAQAEAIDNYNFPSTCVDFANTGDVGLCVRYLLPGLPRFSSTNVLGMDETTNAFVDSIVAEKANNCVARGDLNFLTVNTWAYNVLTDEEPPGGNITSRAPQIGTAYMGAFPKAFEIAMRIRNLEAQVNAAPRTEGICINPANGVSCNTPLNSLGGPANERSLKAFQSAWRNLGANFYGEGREDNLFKDSFTLREIPPRLDENTSSTLFSLSSLLIPKNSSALNKFYLDLKLMTLNYATFYTAFTIAKGSQQIDEAPSGEVDSEAQCNATKVGLPVPGYPLGFVKNPDFLTYYAVQGRTKFIGMFNPFTNAEVTLTAYAAAKPFGARIGPMLFNTNDISTVTPRQGKKSSPYITALKTETFKGTFGGDIQTGRLYAPGMPIPINFGPGADQFWLVDDTSKVGGWISGPDINFGIPNLIYDYPDSSNISNNSEYQSSNEDIEVVAYGGSSDSTTSFPQAGLYNQNMFEKFKAKLVGVGSNITTTTIDQAITMIKSPTLYETHNYLIPTPENLKAELGTDSWGEVIGGPTNTLTDSTGKSYDTYELKLYAPLVSSTDSIYPNADALRQTLVEYLDFQSPSLKKYVASMNVVAADIFNTNFSGATGLNTGAEAARQISDLPNSIFAQYPSNIEVIKDALPTCASMAGRFVYFYSSQTNNLRNADINGCNANLVELLTARWSNPKNTGDLYVSTYSIPQDLKRELFSAYRPGRMHDADGQGGSFTNKINKRSETMIRNFYSTKFIPLKSLVSSSSEDAFYGSTSTMSIFSEGSTSAENPDIKRSQFKNPLNSGALGIDLSQINH